MRRAWILSVAALTLAACGGGAEEARPNVLVITVDTLRADRLGCYGYGRDTSPNLDAFAEEALRFTRAYSQAPFTAPAHASLFTSLHSNEHGVLSWGMQIPKEAETMAERFAARGYATGAFYNHPTLAGNAIERGFQHAEKRYFEPAADTVDGFLAWASEADAPYCAWVHLWDVHRPFGYRDWSNPLFAEHVQRPPFAFEEERFGTYPDITVGRAEPDYNLTPRKRAERGHAEEAWRFIEDRYDGGVWHVDRALGDLFARMRAAGLYEDTVIVVTADHGEALRERDPVWFTHDPYLYEETLRVPLVVRLPGAARAGETVDTLARGIDVLPTLLDACDLPAIGTRGASLLAPEDADAARYAFAQTQTRHAKEDDAAPADDDGWFERREMVSDGRLKLLIDRNTGREALFDLDVDPAERRDRKADAAYAADLAKLRDVLAGYRALPPAGTSFESLSDEERRQLEAAGYMGD